MNALVFMLLWYTVDDTLATALGVPGLGSLAWWVPFIVGIMIEAVACSQITEVEE